VHGEGRPLDSRAGTAWRFECRQGKKVDHYEGTVIGDERQMVGDRYLVPLT
jgi:hypothetical protein